MRKLGVIIFEILVPPTILAWLFLKYPEIFDAIIPWLAFGWLWYLTWDLVLQREAVKQSLGKVLKKAGRMTWLYAFIAGGCLSLIYLWTINSSLGRLTTEHSRYLATHASSPTSLSALPLVEQPKSGTEPPAEEPKPKSKPPAPKAPELPPDVVDIREQLRKIQEQLDKLTKSSLQPSSLKQRALEKAKNILEWANANQRPLTIYEQPQMVGGADPTPQQKAQNDQRTARYNQERDKYERRLQGDWNELFKKDAIELSYQLKAQEVMAPTFSDCEDDNVTDNRIVRIRCAMSLQEAAQKLK